MNPYPSEPHPLPPSLLCEYVVAREGGYLGDGTGSGTSGSRTPCRRAGPAGGRGRPSRHALTLRHERAHGLTHPRRQDELLPQLDVRAPLGCNRQNEQALLTVQTQYRDFSGQFDNPNAMCSRAFGTIELK